MMIEETVGSCSFSAGPGAVSPAVLRAVQTDDRSTRQSANAPLFLGIRILASLLGVLAGLPRPDGLDAVTFLDFGPRYGGTLAPYPYIEALLIVGMAESSFRGRVL
jgi:hypothetical protein